MTKVKVINVDMGGLKEEKINWKKAAEMMRKENSPMERIKKRLNNVSPGKWSYVVMDKRWGGVYANPSVDRTEDSISYGAHICKILEEPRYMSKESLDAMNANMDFIAHSKEDIKFLLKEIERLEKENKVLATEKREAREDASRYRMQYNHCLGKRDNILEDGFDDV